jgi:imidazolonepropionase
LEITRSNVLSGRFGGDGIFQIYMTRHSEGPSMQGMTLVRGARQLLTLRGPAGPRRGAALRDLGIIVDGAVLIRNGKILETGLSRRLENLAVARGAREINAAGRVIIPGFVDGAAQPTFTPAAPDIEEHVLPGRQLEEHARSRLAGMARHGTTTVAAAAIQGMENASALKTLRVLGSLDGKPLDLVAVYHAAPFIPSEVICAEVLPVIWRRKLAHFVSINCESSDLATARRLLTAARDLGFRLSVHAGLRMVLEMEVESVALDSIEPAGIEALAGSHTIALLAPASIYHRRLERYPPARALVDAGAAVSLVSGFGFEQCPTYNMQMVISLACAEMGLSPAEAISAATINGAYAVGRGDRCGSLEPGKNADMLLLNIEDYREIPHQFGINHVHMVLKNGAIIYREGEVTSWTGK